jgi:protein involved in polysaccharide export with SLBB domain
MRLSITTTSSALLAATLLACASAVGAQSVSLQSGNSTRAELQALAAGLEQAASSDSLPREAKQARLAEAKAIRQRLDVGDFVTGDRIVVIFRGDSARTDTLVVRSGQHVSFRTLPELSLEGVLRSELKDHLVQHVSRYLRNPQLIVIPLLRVSVLGQVTRPGYYPLSSDALVSDAIMAAGGPTPLADLERTRVSRGGRELLSEKELRVAMQNGRTLDDLGVHEGDEIVVGKRPERNWNLVISFITAGLGVLTGVALLARH